MTRLLFVNEYWLLNTRIENLHACGYDIPLQGNELKTLRHTDELEDATILGTLNSISAYIVSVYYEYKNICLPQSK